MASNTRSSKRACASIYFQFSSCLGLCLIRLFQIWYIDSFCQEQEQVLLVAQPEVIYAYVRHLTSGFLTNWLKIPLNVGIQAKCSWLIGNWGR